MIYTCTRRRPIKRLMGLALVSAGLLAWAALLPGRAGSAIAQATAPSWSYTGNFNTARFWCTATLLPSGKVLVAGGDSAELYDPAIGTWSYTGNLNTARGGFTATLLQNGKVLVAGGSSTAGALKSAELYDPATGAWSYTGNLSRRDYHTATLLPNGQVLVAGGQDFGYDIGFQTNLLSSSEIYDPATGNWSSTANLNVSRWGHTATLLPNGKALVVGGQNWSGVPTRPELYNSGNTSVPNPIDDSQFFIRQQYLDFLNREPDQGGSDYWTSQITECGTNQQCIHDRRIAVSAAFFIEQEFQDTGYFVYRFYKASLGRQPNYTEFTSDRSKVIGGDDLETRKQAFVAEWTQRPSFLQQYPLSMSAEDFVNKLFDTSQLMSLTTERKQEMDALNDNIKTRSQVLRDVVEMQEFKTREYNGAFVRMQYFGYLRRDPDTGGESFWLDVLNNRLPQDGSGYRSMVCAFITSTEYQLRFGTVITRSNQDCTP